MKFRSILSLGVMLGSLLPAVPGRAAIFNFSFTGAVTQKGIGAISDATNVGDPIFGLFSYDNSVSERTPGDPTFSQYFDSSAMSLTLTGLARKKWRDF